MRSRERRRGNSIVEFALAFPMLVISFGGCFQFGYTFFLYNRLENSVRSAARYASLRAYDSQNSTPSSAFSTAVKNVAIYGNPDGGTQTTAPGLTSNHVQITVNVVDGVPDTMTVAISGYAVNGIFGTRTFTSKPAATFRYGGRYAP
jgi:Flp pilus assembly protein TadG